MSIARVRLLTYGILLLFIWGYYQSAKSYFDHFQQLETWSMLLGYIAFWLIGITLLIGPVKQWLPAKFNQYILAIRRDVGILAGLTAFLHVSIVLYIFERGTKMMIFILVVFHGIIYVQSIKGEPHTLGDIL